MAAFAQVWNAAKKRFFSKGDGPHGHSIGYWGGVCLLANNITGPGMVLIPSVFAQSGWLFPTVLFVVTGSLSALSVLYLAKSLTLVPGNENLQKRMEFAPLIKMLFPPWLYRITFFGLLFLLQITNIGSIVISAQTMDYTAMTIGGKTCALTLYSTTWSGSSVPSSGSYVAGDSSAVHPIFQCIVSGSNSSSTKDSVFGEDYVLSIGYVIVAVIVIPMGVFNLEDNIWVQKAGFVGLLFCVVAWLVQFMFVSGIDTSLTPALGEISSWGPSISLIVFNFGFTLTVPSWIHEKEPSISTSSSVWASVIISGIMFLSLGILGSWSRGYTDAFASGQDLLAAVSAAPVSNSASLAASYLFPIVALLSGIPVFSIIVRYNLVENGINKLWANFWAVLFPWAAALCVYSGSLLNAVTTWSSALSFVLLNFSLPLACYIILHKRGPQSGALVIKHHPNSDSMSLPLLCGDVSHPPVELTQIVAVFPRRLESWLAAHGVSLASVAKVLFGASILLSVVAFGSTVVSVYFQS